MSYVVVKVWGERFAQPKSLGQFFAPGFIYSYFTYLLGRLIVKKG